MRRNLYNLPLALHTSVFHFHFVVRTCSFISIYVWSLPLCGYTEYARTAMVGEVGEVGERKTGRSDGNALLIDDVLKEYNIDLS